MQREGEKRTVYASDSDGCGPDGRGCWALAAELLQQGLWPYRRAMNETP